MVMPRMVTLVVASMPNALAKLVNCVMTIRPPVDIIDIMTNISQNTGDRSISRGVAPRPRAGRPERQFDVAGVLRRPQRERADHADGGEDRAEDEQGVLVAGRLHHAVDREGGEDGAEAVAGRHHAGRQSAPLRKPFHHQPDDADIDDAGADAAQQAVGGIEAPERVDGGRRDPAGAAQQRAGADQQFRAQLLDQETLHRRQPGLQHDQDRDRPLHVGERRAGGLLERRHEQGPDILRARDHHHDDEAHEELDPAGRGRFGDVEIHGVEAGGSKGPSMGHGRASRREGPVEAASQERCHHPGAGHQITPSQPADFKGYFRSCSRARQHPRRPLPQFWAVLAYRQAAPARSCASTKGNGSVRRGGPCARPPLRVRGPAGDHKGRPYEHKARATPSLQLKHTTSLP